MQSEKLGERIEVLKDRYYTILEFPKIVSIAAPQGSILSGGSYQEPPPPIRSKPNWTEINARETGNRATIQAYNDHQQ